jgi:hypothetical protein
MVDGDGGTALVADGSGEEEGLGAIDEEEDAEGWSMMHGLDVSRTRRKLLLAGDDCKHRTDIILAKI